MGQRRGPGARAGARPPGESFPVTVSWRAAAGSTLSYLHYQVAMRTFSLIVQVPDRVSRWFGQGSEGMHEDDNTKQAAGLLVSKVETKADRMGNTMGGAAGGRGAKPGKETPDAGDKPPPGGGCRKDHEGNEHPSGIAKKGAARPPFLFVVPAARGDQLSRRAAGLTMPNFRAATSKAASNIRRILVFTLPSNNRLPLSENSGLSGY